jgi:hypothetical protein
MAQSEEFELDCPPEFSDNSRCDPLVQAARILANRPTAHYVAVGRKELTIKQRLEVRHEDRIDPDRESARVFR